jgi:hypothetical protein
VLKAGGRIAVFDKFLADGERPSLLRRALDLPARVLASELNRRMGDILERAGAPLTVERDEPAFRGDVFRILLLRKGTSR